jgi:hypothetical protein
MARNSSAATIAVRPVRPRLDTHGRFHQHRAGRNADDRANRGSHRIDHKGLAYTGQIALLVGQFSLGPHGKRGTQRREELAGKEGEEIGQCRQIKRRTQVNLTGGCGKARGQSHRRPMQRGQTQRNTRDGGRQNAAQHRARDATALQCDSNAKADQRDNRPGL